MIIERKRKRKESILGISMHSSEDGGDDLY